MEVDENKTRPKSLWAHLYQQVQEQSEFCDVTVEVNSWVNRLVNVLLERIWFQFQQFLRFQKRHRNISFLFQKIKLKMRSFYYICA